MNARVPTEVMDPLPFDPAQRPVAPPTDAPAWRYPSEADFARCYSRRGETHPYTLVEARCDLFLLPEGVPEAGRWSAAECEAWLARARPAALVHEAPALFQLVPWSEFTAWADPVVTLALPAHRAALRGTPSVVRSEFQRFAEGTFFLRAARQLYRATPVRVHAQGEAPPERFMAPWSYASALCDPGHPLYLDEHDDAAEFGRRSTPPARYRRPSPWHDEAVVEALRALIGSMSEATPDRSLVLAVEDATRLGRLDLALALCQRYRPRMISSRDPELPRSVWRYAQLAARAGQVAAAAALCALAMGEDEGADDASGHEGRAEVTAVGFLAGLGVDPELFLRGLTLAYDAPDPRPIDVPLWGIARALTEGAPEVDALRAARALACDPALDVSNQLRAAQLWWHLLRALRDDPHTFRRDDLVPLASEPALPRTTRIWVESMQHKLALALGDEAR